MCVKMHSWIVAPHLCIPTKRYTDLKPEPALPKRQRQSQMVKAAVIHQPPVPPPPMGLPPSGPNSLVTLSPSHLPSASHHSPATFPLSVRRSLSVGMFSRL